MGEELIKPLSVLRVRLPLTLTSQDLPPALKLIQQQLEYLTITKVSITYLSLTSDPTNPTADFFHHCGHTMRLIQQKGNLSTSNSKHRLNLGHDSHANVIMTLVWVCLQLFLWRTRGSEVNK